MGPYTYRGILNLMPNNGWAIDGGVVKLNGALYCVLGLHAGGRPAVVYIADDQRVDRRRVGSRISLRR